MGQGKTEAALYAADLAMCKGFARGMYVAMPTQATGNAMFKRVLDDYLKNNKIVALEKIDTRALTKVLRDSGTMKGIITLEENLSEDHIKEKLDAIVDIAKKAKPRTE